MNNIKKETTFITSLILIFLTAFVSKLVFIGTRDICLDEPFTIFNAQKSLLDILRLPTQNEPNPPLFMLILHFWIKLFGISPFSVRIMPLLFNSLTAVFIFLAGKKVFNIWAGIIGTIVFLLSTYHFYFGLETRAYAMLSFATIASYYYFNEVVKYPEKNKNIILLFIANFFLIYSHYFGWFVVFAQFLSSLFYFKEKKNLYRIWIVISLTAISFIPMAIVFIKQFLKSSQGTWVTPPHNRDYFDQLHAFLNFFSPMFIVLILVGLLVFKGVAKEKNQNRKELWVLFIWWFIPYTIMFLVSKKIPMFLNRYILFNSVTFYLFLSALISIYYKKWNWATYLVTSIIGIFMFIKLEVNSKNFYYREVQNAVNHVSEFTDSSSIVIIHPHWASLGFTYYYQPEIFKNPDKYDSLLNVNNILPVWNVRMAKDYLIKNPERKVIYYQDGSIFAENTNAIFKYLDSTYIRKDSVFYPQCFNVSVFEPRE
ncbi:MAG: hypothetical protein A2W97_04920 [Bacteroidetes bacterium GWE2_40_63]|nr:MAG: hypothetical protein A2W97_04920 [Bacteroidetes bacterium GWE2_40_63]OFY19701.1 MAG: hypothetical protein A2W88_02810 [Bacteroidetes bacterium GWF2_40_13]